MVGQVKAHKAGFVTSGANTKPESTLTSLLELMTETGHSTIPVTVDGSAKGEFCGLITDQDFWEFEDDLGNSVKDHMTPKSEVFFGTEGITLRKANQLLHHHKKDCLPILDRAGNLNSLVLTKIKDCRWEPLSIHMIIGSAFLHSLKRVLMFFVLTPLMVLQSFRWMAFNGFANSLVTKL
jgi:IMP dehydrogenase